MSDKSSMEQHKRFLDTARAVGCDEDKEKFEGSLRKIAAHKPSKGALKKPQPRKPA